MKNKKQKISANKIKTDGKTIVLAEDSGIGNRIQFMFSCIRIFKMEEFELYWPSSGWVNKSFKELFNFEGISVTEYNEPVLARNIPDEPPLSYTEGWRLYVDKNDGVPKHFAKLYNNAKHGYSIDLEYNRIPKRTLDIYLPLFEKLKPSEEVSNRINTLEIDGDFVALQVRNNPDWLKHKRNIELKKYFKAMDNYPKDTLFFLCAMNEDVAAEFQNKYGERIIVLPGKNYASMIDATADLYIMSRANEAIYSYESTFGCLAWWLGGGKAKVKIVGPAGRHLKTFIKNLKIRLNG